MVFIRTAAVVACLLAFSPLSLAADEPVTKQFGKEIAVYKSPSCSCCAGWAQHLRHSGFRVTIVDQYDLSEIKAQYGIGPELQSCHTAVVDGYAIEGHVPADDIWRLLAERPDASGLAAPGMPAMSPGMNSDQPKGYDVLLFGPDSRSSVYSRY
jgi:hypothetical protein